MHLQGKKILLGITGSIAAYKAILLLRLLVKQGATVKVIMTEAAKDFVSPLVLETLSGEPVVSGLASGSQWANHVMLGRWADAMVIAPLSCNTLSRMAHGQCDNLLLAVYLSATCPVMAFPAMDEDMWLHPSTRRNIALLQGDGVQVMPVGYGPLGSGLTGEGRMAEPETILYALTQLLAWPGKPLQGKKAMVTAGPTYEPIDPVRFIGNRSTGTMGIAVARQLQLAGATVHLILGPSAVAVPPGIHVERVATAAEMLQAAQACFPKTDIAVFSAAVADFRPAAPFAQKWKKGAQRVPAPIALAENADILKTCAAGKKPGQTVVGFALETDNEAENAMRKMLEKNADLMVLNSLRDAGAGFGTDTNKITIFGHDGTKKDFPLQSKEETAVHIAEAIINIRP